MLVLLSKNKDQENLIVSYEHSGTHCIENLNQYLCKQMQS